MKILMVLTSHDRLGNTGRATGFWLEEFAAPYYVFKDAGAQIVLASPKGGPPPLDPKSDEPDAQTAATGRYREDKEAIEALTHTERLSNVVRGDFDAVFYPGGHGPMWDLAEDPDSIELIEACDVAHRPLGAVCHAPAAFRNALNRDGDPLVKGRNVTAFSNSEEEAVGLTDVVPFLLEEVLKANGASYTKGEDWKSHVVVDGHLVTGQNPASSEDAARALLKLLGR
ncbi:type 1 glutamine amidotransferase domain-containing protein [Lysobacter sp. A3-1-A15]|uniref:type 1 glutamine amidotransferase domain-containing protein n=1 Tax=Novilysobacter viscosus TaxID=3098602 RepID=UPI002EDB1F7B